MKLTIASILLWAVLVVDSRKPPAILVPEITIGMSTADIDGTTRLQGIEPTLKWQSAKRVGETELEGGLSLTMQDVDVMPYSLWGKVKRRIRGWDCSARLDTKSSALTNVGIDLLAKGASTAVEVKASSDVDRPSLFISSLALTQTVMGLGGVWTIIPRYNIPGRKADLKLSYGLEDTMVVLDASADRQKITLAQRIGENNAISPSITTDGKVELEYHRALDNGSSLTTRFKPNEAVEAEWKDGPWTATFRAPMDGIVFNDGVEVNVRRTVEIM